MRSIFSCPIRLRLEKDIPKPPCPAPELNPQKKSKLHLSLRLRRLSAFESTKDNKASTWSCMGLERFRPLLKTHKHSVTWASMVGPFLAHTLLNLPTSVQHRNRFFDQLCIGDARRDSERCRTPTPRFSVHTLPLNIQEKVKDVSASTSKSSIWKMGYASPVAQNPHK